MVIGKKLVGIEIRQLSEFINILNITDMPRIYLAGSNPGINAFIVLPVIKA